MDMRDAPTTGPAAGRRSERVFLRIPIAVEGKEEDGRPFRENTFTLVINRHGARICSQRLLAPGEHITIRNLQTGDGCSFRVVGRVGKSLGEGPEWGVECLGPDQDIWGIYFPSEPLVPRPEVQVDALMECSACNSRELARLTIGQYRELTEQGALTRPCQRCGSEKEWRFGFIDRAAEGGPAAAEPKTELRHAKRLTVKLPVRIRLQDGREEVARTENLSQTGMCFVSDLEMQTGDFIQLTVGYAPGGGQDEVTARVIWRKAIEGTNRYAYGVHVEEKG